MTRRRRLVPAAMAAAALALAGCGNLDGGASDQIGSAGKGPRSISAVNMKRIELITGPQNPGSQIGMGLCEPLTLMTDDGDIFMGAAQSVTSKDQRTWTIKLKPGHTFSNGTPLEAQGWVDSFNFVALGKNAMPANYAYMDIEGYADLNPEDPKAKPKSSALSGLKVIDRNTFTLTMARPNNDVPFMLTSLPFCPMPKYAFKDPLAYDKKPVGNGPYVMSRLDPQVEAVLKKSPTYKGWKPKDFADEIVFRVYTDAATAYQDVVAGNTDIMRQLPPGLVAQAKAALGDKGLTGMPQRTHETYFAWPTYLDKKFPKKVRQAFSKLIDREGIAQHLFLGSAEPARSLMPNSVSAYRSNPCGPTCAFDPAGAKRLLKESGFKGTIPVYYSVDGGNATSDAAAVMAIANEAKKVGLTIEPRPTSAATLSEQVNDYQLTGPALQLWGSSYPRASEWIASIPIEPNYRLKYKNPAVNEAIAQAKESPNDQAADPHWQRAEDLILDDQVIQPLYYQVMDVVHSPCTRPGGSGGDMIIIRTHLTCSK